MPVCRFRPFEADVEAWKVRRDGEPRSGDEPAFIEMLPGAWLQIHRPDLRNYDNWGQVQLRGCKWGQA